MDYWSNKLTDLATQMKSVFLPVYMLICGQDILEKGTKAFISFIRAYKEHQCSFIFRWPSYSIDQLTHTHMYNPLSTGVRLLISTWKKKKKDEKTEGVTWLSMTAKMAMPSESFMWNSCRDVTWQKSALDTCLVPSQVRKRVGCFVGVFSRLFFFSMLDLV